MRGSRLAERAECWTRSGGEGEEGAGRNGGSEEERRSRRRGGGMKEKEDTTAITPSGNFGVNETT